MENTDVKERILRLQKSFKFLRADINSFASGLGGMRQSLQDTTQGVWVEILNNRKGGDGDLIPYLFRPLGCSPGLEIPYEISIIDGELYWSNSDFGGVDAPAGFRIGNVVYWTYNRRSGPDATFYVQVDPPEGYTALSWISPPTEIVDPGFVPCYLLSPDPTTLTHCGPVGIGSPYGMGWTGDTIYAQVTIRETSCMSDGGYVVGATYNYPNVPLTWDESKQGWTGKILTPFIPTISSGSVYFYIGINAYTSGVFVRGGIPEGSSGIYTCTNYPYETASIWQTASDDGSSDPFTSPLSSSPSSPYFNPVGSKGVFGGSSGYPIARYGFQFSRNPI